MISDKSTNKSEVLTEEEIVEMYAPPKSAILNDATPKIPSEKEGMNAIGLILLYREILFALRKDGGWEDVSDEFHFMATFRKGEKLFYIKYASDVGNTSVVMLKGLSDEEITKYSRMIRLKANDTNTNIGIAQIRSRLESFLQKNRVISSSI